MLKLRKCNWVLSLICTTEGLFHTRLETATTIRLYLKHLTRRYGQIRMLTRCFTVTEDFNTRAKSFTPSSLQPICGKACPASADVLTTGQRKASGGSSNPRCTTWESSLRVTIWFQKSSIISISAITNAAGRGSNAWRRWSSIAPPREKFHPAAQQGGIPSQNYFVFFTVYLTGGASLRDKFAVSFFGCFLQPHFLLF